MTDLPPQVQRRIAEQPEALRRHLARTAQIARDLALEHGLDAHKAELAGACHDLARAVEPDTLLEEARRLGIDVGPVEQKLPVLLHGFVAAAWLEREMDVTDSEIVQAVYWHSTGCAGMSGVARVVFIADKIDDVKVKTRPHLKRIRDLAYEDLDAAILEFVDGLLRASIESGGVIHPAAIEMRNELLEGGGRACSS